MFVFELPFPTKNYYSSKKKKCQKKGFTEGFQNKSTKGKEVPKTNRETFEKHIENENNLKTVPVQRRYKHAQKTVRKTITHTKHNTNCKTNAQTMYPETNNTYHKKGKQVCNNSSAKHVKLKRKTQTVFKKYNKRYNQNEYTYYKKGTHAFTTP